MKEDNFGGLSERESFEIFFKHLKIFLEYFQVVKSFREKRGLSVGWKRIL